MTINSLISQEDIKAINKSRSSSQTTPLELDSLLATAEAQLTEMHIYDAAVDLIRTQEGHILWGSGRVPLVIQSAHQRFVLKPYDVYNPTEEKRILKVVQGKLAPIVLYFGNGFYAEELIDLEKAKTLESIADSGDLRHAVIKGAEIYSELARLGINYNHRHWLDEFHLVGDNVRITDFGTSTFFRKADSSKDFSERVRYAADNGVGRYVDEFRPIPVFAPDRPNYEETKVVMAGLSENAETAVNLLYVLMTGIIGIKDYIERAGWKIGVDPRAWDRAMEIFPLFVKSFANSYKAAQPPK